MICDFAVEQCVITKNGTIVLNTNDFAKKA